MQKNQPPSDEGEPAQVIDAPLKPAEPMVTLNRKARRAAEAKARAAGGTHHNTLADKADHLLARRSQRGYFEGLAEFIIVASVLSVVGLVLGGVQLVHAVAWLWHHVTIR